MPSISSAYWARQYGDHIETINGQLLLLIDRLLHCTDLRQAYVLSG